MLAGAGSFGFGFWADRVGFTLVFWLFGFGFLVLVFLVGVYFWGTGGFAWSVWRPLALGLVTD